MYKPAILPQLAAETVNDAFFLIMEIESVVLIYGDRRRLHADEHNHAGRLMRELDQLGRAGVDLRAVIKGRRVLDRSSLRALNLYLRHGHGLTAFRRVCSTHSTRHRYAWRELESLLGLRWVN